MDKLREFLNGKPKLEQAEFAKRCGTTIGYLRKAINKKQELGAELSVSIERESFGLVTRIDLHPENWRYKWPELANKRNDKAA